MKSTPFLEGKMALIAHQELTTRKRVRKTLISADRAQQDTTAAQLRTQIYIINE